MSERTAAQTFGDNLRRIRYAADVTQVRLAEAMGCKQSHIARLESGARAPSLEYLFRLADALGVEPADLVAR